MAQYTLGPPHYDMHYASQAVCVQRNHLRWPAVLDTPAYSCSCGVGVAGAVVAAAAAAAVGGSDGAEKCSYRHAAA